jgi:hypothetical protein
MGVMIYLDVELDDIKHSARLLDIEIHVIEIRRV